MRVRCKRAAGESGARAGRLLLRGRRGQELVQLLLALPVLVLLVLLLLNVGFAMYSYQVVQEAARNGCRTGVVNRMDPVRAAREVAESYGDLPGERDVFIGVGADFLLCRVVYRVPALGPGLPTITVTGQTKMRMEGW